MYLKYFWTNEKLFVEIATWPPEREGKNHPNPIKKLIKDIAYYFIFLEKKAPNLYRNKHTLYLLEQSEKTILYIVSLIRFKVEITNFLRISQKYYLRPKKRNIISPLILT